MSSLVVILVDSGELKGKEDVINEIVQLVKESKNSLILLTREVNSNFEECKEAVGELQQAIEKSGENPQVAILFSRKNGERDKMDLVRWNLNTKINHMLKTIDCEATLKDTFQNLVINRMITDDF